MAFAEHLRQVSSDPVRWETRYGPLLVSLAELSDKRWEVLIVLRLGSKPLDNVVFSMEYTEYSWENTLRRTEEALRLMREGFAQAADSLNSV